MFITTACTSKSRSKKNSSNSSSNTLSTVPCLFTGTSATRVGWRGRLYRRTATECCTP